MIRMTLWNYTSLMDSALLALLLGKSNQDAADRQRKDEAAERRAERQAADMAKWRNVGADVLGRVREFMNDVHPDRVMINIQKGAEKSTSDKLFAKWETLREPISQLAIGHPSATARELADEVSSGMHRILHWVVWTLSDFAANRSFTEALSQAKKDGTSSTTTSRGCERRCTGAQHQLRMHLLATIDRPGET
jgi:hypothetical protein